MALPAPGEVHVWSVDLDAPADRALGVLGGMLSADELLRAGAVKSERGRRRALVTRAAVRALLARYLDRRPAELAFGAGPHGKPRLDPASPLRFNLSHSGPWALIAVAHSAEVGVDVEHIHPRHDLPGLARKVFAEAERETIDAAPPAAREDAFYRHWVAKEAFVKATGRGIGASLRCLRCCSRRPAARASCTSAATPARPPAGR